MPCFLSPLSGNSVAAWLSSIFILTFILSLSFSLFPSLSPFFFLSLSSFSPPPLPLPLSLFFPLLSLPFSALPLALHPYLPPMSYLPVGLDWVHSSSHFFFFPQTRFCLETFGVSVYITSPPLTVESFCC